MCRIYTDMRRVYAEDMRICAEYVEDICRYAQCMWRTYADMRRVCGGHMRICARYVQDTCRIYAEYMGYAIGIGEGNGAVFKETYDRECYLRQ